ncbi:hypothetical protein GCM10008944_03800 [Cytobacillus oceanisediminis]
MIAEQCLECGRRVSRFWGAGFVYESANAEIFTDFSVAGFCLKHRDSVLELMKATSAQKGTLAEMLDPPVELRKNEIAAFLAFVASGSWM